MGMKKKIGGIVGPLKRFLMAGSECAEKWGAAVGQWRAYISGTMDLHETAIKEKKLWMQGEHDYQAASHFSRIERTSGLDGRRQVWRGAMMALLSNSTVAPDVGEVANLAKVCDKVLEEEMKRGTFGAEKDAALKVYEAYQSLCMKLEMKVPSTLIPELERLKADILDHQLKADGGDQ